MPIYNAFAGGKGGVPPTAVKFTDLQNGDFLKYSSADLAFINTSVAGSVTSLDTLTDVTAPSPSTNDYLKWNGTAWVNAAALTIPSTLAALTGDVNISSPSNGQVLTYQSSSSKWINSASSGGSTLADGDYGDIVVSGSGTVLSIDTAASPQVTALNIGHASDTTLSRSSAGVLEVEGNELYAAGGTDVPVTDGGTGASTAADARTNLGLTDGRLWFGAAAMWPSTTDGAQSQALTETGTNALNYWGVDFADADTTYAEATIAMPDDWDASTVTAQFYWLADSATSNSVVWEISGVSLNDGDAIDAAQGTVKTVTDANGGTANQVRISAATPAITVAGTPAAGSLVQWRFGRLGANASDTLAATATLLGAMIFYGKT